MFKKEILKLLKKYKIEESLIEIPPDTKLGDYALPCFTLAKQLKKSPLIIAQELKQELKPNTLIIRIENNGPYLNFFINKSKQTEQTLKTIFKQKQKYGNQKQNKRILVEFPGPNTNKPLHLGHLRNIFLGMSITNILKKLGHKVTIVDIINDRGIHICKSMLAYQKFGNNKQPDIKPDHFVGKYYVLYNQKQKTHPEMEQEIQEILEKWEKNDKQIRALWKKMNKWALDGFKQTYKKLNFEHNKQYYESEHYAEGKNLVLQGLKKGLFYKNKEGAVVIDLKKYKLGEKILIRPNGTSVYVTQDISLALKRYKEHKMDKMIFIVGNEQKYHFKVLFKILEKLGYKFVKNFYHFAHGMINLLEGKMKSREGTVVDADDIIGEMSNIAKQEIKKRNPKLTKKELEKRSLSIGLAALRFFILKIDAHKNMVYNPKQSIDFEGETGPYVQYTHARICSILKKYKNPVEDKVNFNLLNHEHENNLITMLNNFSEIIQESAKNYKPSLITRYLIDLCQEFNSFYTTCPVLKADKETKKTRILLIDSVRQVLSIGLNLLAIDALEEM